MISFSKKPKRYPAIAAVFFISKGYTEDNACQLALKKIASSGAKQSVLLSNMEIFTVVGYAMLVIVIFWVINQHIKQTVDIFKNRIWGN